MGTNEGWPEAFGFSVSGDHPVVISAVEEEGSAQQAGLQTGDVVVELDGENVEQWTREEVGEVHVNTVYTRSGRQSYPRLTINFIFSVSYKNLLLDKCESSFISNSPISMLS